MKTKLAGLLSALILTVAGTAAAQAEEGVAFEGSYQLVAGRESVCPAEVKLDVTTENGRSYAHLDTLSVGPVLEMNVAQGASEYSGVSIFTSILYTWEQAEIVSQYVTQTASGQQDVRSVSIQANRHSLIYQARSSVATETNVITCTYR